MHEQTIFSEALELEPAQRAAYLAAVCAERPGLRKRLDDLFDAHDHAAGFMEHPAPIGNVASATSAWQAEDLETLLGPYRLVEQIGEGGFGVVFRAEQTVPIQREVAIKIIKPGMDTRAVIVRFEAERQVLALMDHPNIARVVDAGATNAGRPYFVMELVRGIPITDYCDRRRLSIPERVALFVTVCRAVQHAHQKGIIHRDLKPSNVLVTQQDEKPVAKVIDFGVAKATHEPPSDHTVVTGEVRFVGTPLYISPEQVTFDIFDVDTRSDVYSLGALLDELLSGTPPFDRQRLRQAPFDEICRIIREEDAPAPSAKIAVAGEAGEQIAKARRTDRRKLQATLRGELDSIVAKSIEKDRSRRYASAAAVAEDCENFLRNKAVSAHPASTLYRLRKMSRRYKIALSTAALVAAALLGGGGVATWQAIRATHAEALAQRSLEAEIQARHDADTARRLAEANFQQAQKVVDEYFTRVSESRLLDVPGLQPLRKDLLEAAKKYYENFVAQPGTDPEVQATLAAGYLRLAQISNALDDNDNAVGFLGQGLSLVEQLQAGGANWRLLYRRLGGVYAGGRGLHRGTRRPSDPKKALAVLQRGSASWSKFVRDEPANLILRNDLAGFQFVTGDLLRGLRDLEPALRSLESAAEIWSGLSRENPSNPEYRANLARCQGQISDVYRRLDRRQERDATFARMLELEESLVRSHPDVAEYRLELALALTDGGRSALNADDLPRSNALLQRSRDLLEALAGASGMTPVYLESLAIACATQSDCHRRALDFEKAEICTRRGLAKLEILVQLFPKLSRYRRELAGDYRNAAFFLLTVGRRDDAETAYRMALDNFEQLTVEEPQESDHLRQFAWCLAASPFPRLQDARRATAFAQESVRLSPGDPACWEAVGMVQCRNGQFNDALKSLEKSARLSAAEDGFCQAYLALVWRKLGKVDDARKSYDRAVAWRAAKQPHNDELDRTLAEVREFLGEIREGKTSRSELEPKTKTQEHR